MTVARIENNFEEKHSLLNEDIKLLHVDTLELEKLKRLIRRKIYHIDYNSSIRIFKKNFTTFKRGYCLTCYKIQGSEFKHVFVNLKSFWACLLNNRFTENETVEKNIKLLFSAFYTACTRSTRNLYLYWF